MTEARTFASLEPKLLARKGGAKPAMRPQMFPFAGYESNAALELDDLGWNDMGEDYPEARDGAEILPLTPLAANPEAEAQTDQAAQPVVRRQQEAIGKRLSKPLPRRRSALEAGRRAAFTLRVDAERHLRLRLACTVRNRSAQQIVTEALDKLLADMPELDSLAKQVKRTT